MRNPTRSPLPFSAALLLAAAIGASPARAAEIFPTETAPGKTFTLTVTGKTFLCQPTFSDHEAVFGNGTLHLSVVGESNPAALCTAGEHPYKVSFQVPAAKAGLYAVDVAVIPPCVKAALCEIAIKPEPAGVLTVKDTAGPAQTATISPTDTESGRTFSLTLSGTTMLCMPVFSMHSATASNGTLNLIVKAENNPLAKCTTGPHAYKTVFKVPALTAGTYKVLVSLLPACSFDKPPCLTGVPPAYAGTLTVRDRPVWTEPARVVSGSGFLLELHGGYTCNDVLTDKQVDVKDGAIRLRYTLSLTKRICPDTIFVHHETFSVPALKNGAYPVFLAPNPHCPTGHFLCGETLATRAVDTVSAASVVGLKPGLSSLGGKPAGNAGLRIDLREGTVKGAWKGSDADLSGRKTLPAR